MADLPVVAARCCWLLLFFAFVSYFDFASSCAPAPVSISLFIGKITQPSQAMEQLQARIETRHANLTLPFGPLKSGIPADVLTPAPVKITMRGALFMASTSASTLTL